MEVRSVAAAGEARRCCRPPPVAAAAGYPEGMPQRARGPAFAATLAAGMGIGPFALIAVGALSPLIVADLGLSRTGLGSLATVTFGVAAVTSIVGGRRVDVWGGRRVLTGVFLSGGVAVAMMAAAPSLPWLWAAAVLVGATQAVANPATNRLIAGHVPRGRQGLHVGVKQSGVQMAQAVIGFALPPLAVVVGWRGSVLVGLALAALGAVAAWGVLPPSAGGDTAPDGGRRRVEPVVWWLAAYTFVMSLTIQPVLIYSPLYGFERVGLTAGIAGMATGVLGVSGVVARIGWGRVAERAAAPMRTLTGLAAIAFVSVGLVAAGEHVSPWLWWPGLAGFGASAVAVNAVVMLTVVRSAGERTGQASGVVGLGLYLGYMLGPLGFGALVDATGSYALGWMVVAALCLVALALMGAWRRHAREPAEAAAGAGG